MKSLISDLITVYSVQDDGREERIEDTGGSRQRHDNLDFFINKKSHLSRVAGKLLFSVLTKLYSSLLVQCISYHHSNTHA